MDDLSQKTKKGLLFLPIIPITIVVVYSILLEFIFISKENIPFFFFFVFKDVFQYYPTNIYDYYWYIYTPSFMIQFFWINLVPFYFGLAIWILLKIVIILLIWKKILYSKEMRNFSELFVFVILVLILGAINEINMGNSDAILLACGFLGYICLDKAQKIQGDETYSNKFLSKNNTIILLNTFTGFIVAFGMFKPLFFVFFPLFIFKSNRKIIFISLFLIWLIVSNFLFILHPELLIQYIQRALSGQTLMIEESLFNNDVLNSIFRNGFTPFRIQLWFYPAVMFYIHEIVKNEKIRKYWSFVYLICVIIFNILSLLLFILGF